MFHLLVSYLGLRRNVVFGVKGDPFFAVYKTMPRFDVGCKTVVHISCFVPLMCRIRDIVIRMIKIILLASTQLIFTLDKLSDVLFER